MMTFIGVVVLVAGFFLLMKVFGVVEKSTEVIKVSRLALSDIKSTDLDDISKEAALQLHAKRLFLLFLGIVMGCSAALILPAVVLLFLDRIDLLSFNAVLTATLSWEFILLSVVLVAAFMLYSKKQ